MKKTTVRISAAALGVIVTTALVAVGTYAFGPGRGGGMFGPKNEAVVAAIEAGDYSAWLEAVGENSPIARDITEENFSKFVQAHELMQAGNYEEAKAIKEELGLEGMGGPFRNNGRKRPPIMDEEARAALEAGDYNAWLEAIEENSRIQEIIDSQEKFDKLVEAHNHMTAANDIMKELGMPGPRRMMWK